MTPEPVSSSPLPGEPRQPLRLYRLFDRWHFGTLALLLILTFLRLLRSLGIRAEKHGWRKLTAIFLKKEYSKFTIGVFRLHWFKSAQPPCDPFEARRELITRLREFVSAHSELHWSVRAKAIAFRNHRETVCDIMEAEIDHRGELITLIPHFSPLRPPETDPELVITVIKDVYNLCREAPPGKRIHLITIEVSKRLRRELGWDVLRHRKCVVVAARILNGAFVFFEEQPSDTEEARRRRFRHPEPKRFRHPGSGLFCVNCRFTADYREADLWWQFNHVSVDGAPMQELLSELKREWGSAGEVILPPLNGPYSLPSTMYCGDRIFRTRFFLDSARLISLRKRVNLQYGDQLNGGLTFAGLMLWGISRHPDFTCRKMLLPVDYRDAVTGERQPGLLVIRPGRFGTDIHGLVRFTAEMNRHLLAIRSGRSELGEFLELAGMLHPLLYYLGGKLFPRSLGEVIGTVGLSVIRDAEVFVTPQTDWQIDGFSAVGTLNLPTADGRKAGVVSICGTRKQIRSYYEAWIALERLEDELFPAGPGSDHLS